MDRADILSHVVFHYCFFPDVPLCLFPLDCLATSVSLMRRYPLPLLFRHLILPIVFADIYSNVLHPRTGHTTEPVKIPCGLPLTTN